MNNKTFLAATKRKELIIIHCMDYLEFNDEKDKLEALKHLKGFSHFYRISLSRYFEKPELKKSLRLFILNHEGYNETIKNLYNSLIKD